MEKQIFDRVYVVALEICGSARLRLFAVNKILFIIIELNQICLFNYSQSEWRFLSEQFHGIFNASKCPHNSKHDQLKEEAVVVIVLSVNE